MPLGSRVDHGRAKSNEGGDGGSRLHHRAGVLPKPLPLLEGGRGAADGVEGSAGVGKVDVVGSPIDSCVKAPRIQCTAAKGVKVAIGTCASISYVILVGKLSVIVCLTTPVPCASSIDSRVKYHRATVRPSLRGITADAGDFRVSQVVLIASKDHE